MFRRSLGLLSLSLFDMPKPFGTAKLPKIDDFCRVHFNQTLLSGSKGNVSYEFRTSVIESFLYA